MKRYSREQQTYHISQWRKSGLSQKSVLRTKPNILEHVQELEQTYTAATQGKPVCPDTNYALDACPMDYRSR